MYKHLSFISLFLFLSCTPNGLIFEYGFPTVTSPVALPAGWAFECDFPDELKDGVRAGAAYWNQAMGTDILHEQSSCATFGQLTLVMRYDPIKNDRAIAETQWTIHVGSFIGEINFFVPFSYSNLSSQDSVTRHELGHVFGLVHSDHEDCLMFPTMPKNLSIPKPACAIEQAFVYGTYVDPEEN